MSYNTKTKKNSFIEIEFAFIKVQLLFGIFYYLILNYLIIPNNYFSLTKEDVSLIIYGLLTIILLYIFFYKLFKKMLTNYKHKLLAFFILALGLFITSQLYQNEIELTSFALTSINSPSEILNKRDDEFFVIKDFYIDKNICLNEYDISYSSKNTDIYVKDYFLVPILDDSTQKNSYNIWLGFTFSQNVNNRILTRGDVETNIQNARKRNQYDMSLLDYYKIKYFYKVKFSEDNEYFDSAINEFQNSENNQKNIILAASFNDLSDNRINYLIYILTSILVTNIVFQILNSFFLFKEQESC